MQGFSWEQAIQAQGYDEIMNSLVATAEYYKGISKVYDKTDFVISDNVELESLNQDNDAVFGIYISSKEKYLVNKAIGDLNAKIVEMDEYSSKYYASRVLDVYKIAISNNPKYKYDIFGRVKKVIKGNEDE